MIYKIDNKFYIKVQGYYKEVDLKIDGDNLDITPNGNEIEITNVTNVKVYDMRYNKKDIINEISNKNKDIENQKTILFSNSGNKDMSRRSRRRM